jgi:hypothetical protein
MPPRKRLLELIASMTSGTPSFVQLLALAGPTAGISCSGDDSERPSASTTPPVGQSPNLWWPQNRSWFVSTEIDSVSTYIGGSRRLVDTLQAAPMFEVIEVAPTDRLDAGI